jgi:hypothetical protein
MYRRDLLLSLVAQGCGSAALFGAVVLIGAALGPEPQGAFSRVKSEIEFVATLALFGLPQSVFYYLSAGRLQLKSVLAVTTIIAILALVLAVGYRFGTNESAFMFTAIFALATMAFVTHSMLRIVLLAHTSTTKFTIATAMPQVLLLLFAGALIVLGSMHQSTSASIFCVAFMIASAYAMTKIIPATTIGGAERPDTVGLVEMCRYSFAGGFAAMLAAGAALLMIKTLERSLGAATLGVFTMALMLTQIASMPCNFAAPLVFKQLMKHRAHRTHVLTPLLWAATAFAFMSLVTQALQLVIAPSHLQAYAALLDLQWPLTLTVAADVAFKVSGPSALASGEPLFLLYAETTRLVLLSLGLLAGGAETLSHATWLWAASSTLAATVLMVLLPFRTRAL